MGYTHYWYKEQTIPQDIFNRITSDFKRLMPHMAKYIKLGDGWGEKEPVITDKEVIFNGLKKCGHPKNGAIVIPWPSKDAGGIVTPDDNAHTGEWFAGAELQKRMCNGDCSYETFLFNRVAEREPSEECGLCFDCTKTAFRPYDWAVTAFLVIAKHHLGDKIIVASDGEDGHWFDGKIICQQILGYGLEYQIDQQGDLRTASQKPRAQIEAEYKAKAVRK